MGDRYKDLMEDHSYEEDDRYNQSYSEEDNADLDDYSDDQSWKQQKSNKKSKKQRRREQREMRRGRQDYDDSEENYSSHNYTEQYDQEADSYQQDQDSRSEDPESDLDENLHAAVEEVEEPVFVQSSPQKDPVANSVKEDSSQKQQSSKEEESEEEDPGESIQREKAFKKFKDRFMEKVSPAFSAVKNKTSMIFSRKKEDREDSADEPALDHLKENSDDLEQEVSEEIQSSAQRNWKRIRKQTIWVTAVSTLLLSGVSGVMFFLKEDPEEVSAQKTSMEETSVVEDLQGAFKKPGELLSKVPVQLQGGEKKPGSGGPLRETAKDRTPLPPPNDLKNKLDNFISDVDKNVKKEAKSIDQSIQKEVKKADQFIEKEIKKPVKEIVDKTNKELEKVKGTSGFNVEFNPNGSGAVKITPEMKKSGSEEKKSIEPFVQNKPLPPEKTVSIPLPKDKKLTNTPAVPSDKEKSNTSPEMLPLQTVKPAQIPTATSSVQIPAASSVPAAVSSEINKVHSAVSKTVKEAVPKMEEIKSDFTSPNGLALPSQGLKPQTPPKDPMILNNTANKGTPAVQPPAALGSAFQSPGSNINIPTAANTNGSLVPNGQPSGTQGNTILQPPASLLSNNSGSLAPVSVSPIGQGSNPGSLSNLQTTPAVSPGTPVRIQTSTSPINRGQQGASFVPLQPLGSSVNPSSPQGSLNMPQSLSGSPSVAIEAPAPSAQGNQSVPYSGTNTMGQPSAVPAPQYRIYITREGDNLLSIAGGELGDPMRWVEIKRLNPDPVSKLNLENPVFPVGTKLYLP